MESYKGRCKCGFGCQKRARWKAERSHHNYAYACSEHKHRIEHLPSPSEDNTDLTGADYQTWYNL